MVVVEVLSILILTVIAAVLVGSAINRPRPSDRERLKEHLRALGPDPSLQDMVNSLREHPHGRRTGE
jgi:hypothetical protein